MTKSKKAVVLFSGGLDSILAVKILQSQGIQTCGIFFDSLFFPEKLKAETTRYAFMLSLELKIKDITSCQIDIIRNPKYGFGKNLNPCIDCKILMFKLAKRYMKKISADFIASGEVAGERPFSQRIQAIKTIEKESGTKNLVLRPLSPQISPECIALQNKWVNRNLLPQISGRSRKIQIHLAEKYNISQYPNPSGGCLLTEEKFSRKVKDLLLHLQPDKKIINPDRRQSTLSAAFANEVKLLRIGRHFRINNKAKLIVGRNLQENKKLKRQNRKKYFIELSPVNTPGPTALASPGISQKTLAVCARIVAGYSDKPKERNIKILAKCSGEPPLIKPVYKNIQKNIFRNLIV